jgi:MFS transporter, SHS family, lactate transporter
LGRGRKKSAGEGNCDRRAAGDSGIIRLWAYSHTVPMLALGGFLMQFMVQGAWGVIPAHLNELSPPAVRGTFPGFAYQLGNLLSSRNGVIQAKLAEQHYGGLFAPVLAWTVLIVATLVAVVTWQRHERRGMDMTNTSLGGKAGMCKIWHIRLLNCAVLARQ